MHPRPLDPISPVFPILKVFADNGNHPPVALDRSVCVIGRRTGANLPLRAPQVSKVHALIVRDQRLVYLRDLASTNGVQRNGTPVQEVGLADEDVIRIGSYTLRCASGFSRDVAPPDAAEDAPDAATIPPPAELRSDDAKFSFPRNRHTLLIGRRPACDVRLDHPSVEPVHAILFTLDGRHYVNDLGTLGGTLLNGRSVHREELKPGDELQVGKIKLRYVPVEAEVAEDVEDAAVGEIEDLAEVTGVAEMVDSAEIAEPKIAEPRVAHPQVAEAADADEEILLEPISGSTSDSSFELAIESEIEPKLESTSDSLIEPVIESPPSEADAEAPAQETVIDPLAAGAPSSSPPTNVRRPERDADFAAEMDDLANDDLGDIPPIDLDVVEPETPAANALVEVGDSSFDIIEWNSEVAAAGEAPDGLATPAEEEIRAATTEEDDEETANASPADPAGAADAAAEAQENAVKLDTPSDARIPVVQDVTPRAEPEARDAVPAAAPPADGPIETSGLVEPPARSKPNEDDITTLVDEVAEKVESLKAAWSEFNLDQPESRQDDPA